MCAHCDGGMSVPSALDITADVIVAATALAGFIFVYLGSVAASFDSYEKTAQKSVLGRFQAKAWLSFVGFVFALVSALLALTGEWFKQECLAVSSVVLLLVAFAFVLYVALATVREIK